MLSSYADQVLVRTPEGQDGVVVGPADHWEAIQTWNQAFPDLTEEVKEMVAEGDRVAVHARWSGTQEGVWRGIEPTGRHIEWDVYQFLRFEDGVIVEEVSVMDELHMYVELGVIDRDELGRS